MKILMVLTSHDTLGNTGKPTGFWLEEFAAPYYVFTDAGALVTVASPKGGQPPIDPKSDDPNNQTPAQNRFKADPSAQAVLANTVRLDRVSEKDFDTVFYPGGHGPMWDLAEDPVSIALIESFYNHGKPVAAVCHAPGVLRHVTSNGEPIVKGKRVTGFTNTEEEAVQLTNVVPFLVETELRRLGGRFEKVADWQPFVITDGRLITGQNPASSTVTAKALLELMKSREPSSRKPSVLRALIAASALALLAMGCVRNEASTATTQSAIVAKGSPEAAKLRPFHAHLPEQDIVDLRRRLNTTRWPDRETVGDQSQGVQEAKLKELVRYWSTDYDWRKAEAKLNAFPQFITEIDGLDIHYIHVRSRHPNALPLIITHGWPGSVFELLKAIGPLTDPTAYGGRAEDAFDVVIPSMPGYGFSEKPTGVGWNPEKMARAWDTLMKRVGYTRYVSQGGDWGSVVADVMARQAPPGLLGIHVNMPATVPPEVASVLASGGPAPAGLAPDEKAAFESLDTFYKKNGAYGAMMVTRPQTIGYSLSDSPVGLAAWFYDKFASWTYSGGDPERSLTKDEMLDDVTLTWLTNTGTSGARLYWENNANNFNAVDIDIPAAVTVFPGEIYRAPRSWTERSYHKLAYFHEVEKGGHFAAWEEPQLFAEELRAAFRTMR